MNDSERRNRIKAIWTRVRPRMRVAYAFKGASFKYNGEYWGKTCTSNGNHARIYKTHAELWHNGTLIWSKPL